VGGYQCTSVDVIFLEQCVCVCFQKCMCHLLVEVDANWVHSLDGRLQRHPLPDTYICHENIYTRTIWRELGSVP